jgi:hypothetical protein
LSPFENLNGINFIWNLFNQADTRTRPLDSLVRFIGSVEFLLCYFSLIFGAEHGECFSRVCGSVDHDVTVLASFKKGITHDVKIALLKNINLLGLIIQYIVKLKKLPAIIVMGSSVQSNDIML